MKRIAASIMCADQLHLEDELKSLWESGIDWLHCDVMDGVFVNNLAMAPYVLAPIIQTGRFTTDVHLACVEPEKYIEMFAEIQPDYLTFHVEAADSTMEMIDLIHGKGIKAGLAISPQTPVEEVFPYLNSVELVLMMTVNPGFAGQKFQESVVEKIAVLSREMEKSHTPPLLEVDGNINPETVAKIKRYGVDLYVVGTSALFNDEPGSYGDKVRLMERAIR